MNWIRQDLASNILITVPDFESTWYYGQISFKNSMAEGATATEDPTIRLSLLEAANREPISIAPDESLQKAIAVIIAKDFSQLPIMTGRRELKGMLSWRSIGSRLALGRQCSLVRECMDKPEVLPSDTPLFEAIEAIAKAGCVLVRSPEKTICGIVTATDLNDQFLQLAESFLLISEIDQGIRQLLRGKFSVKELAAAKAPENWSAPES